MCCTNEFSTIFGGDMSAEYPERPVPAVGGIVVQNGKLLLVKRGRPPNEGRWSIPGGSIEEGETAEAAVTREVLEETGITARPVRVLTVADYIERDAEGRVRFHYAIADFLCEFVSGTPAPGSDAADARWIPVREVYGYDVTSTALTAIQIALRERPSWESGLDSHRG